MINCEVSLTSRWPENCLVLDRIYREANPVVVGINNPTNATFKITYTKLYVTVAILSAQNDNKLLEQLKPGFKRTYQM